MPVPLKATLRFVTAPSAVRTRLPLAAPLLCGVNVTVKVRLCPAFRVVGAVKPLMANPAPVMFAVAMCSSDPPVLVRVSERESVPPTCTLPNAMLVGLELSAPAVTPAPFSPILRDGLEALLAITILPVAFPADGGVKVAVKDAL